MRISDWSSDVCSSDLQVIIDFAGSVGGTPFDGGTGEDMAVEIGSGQLIPGFEDQLVGAKTGDEKTLKVTFPEDYPVETLKGQPAEFAVKIGRESGRERVCQYV